MTHLVAYGTPSLSGANQKYIEELAARRQEARRQWPAYIVTLTERGEVLCGAVAHEQDSVAAYDYAFQTPRSEICPGCVEAAKTAGRPLP